MDVFSRSLAAAALVDGQHFTLPGFGTIEGVYISARIDHGARRVEAPRLEVRWENEEDSKAQTFAQLLVRTGASTLEAEETQGDWLDTLTTGESIAIGDLGSLVPDASKGTCSFEADTNGLASAFSGKLTVDLEPISKRALPKEPIAPVVAIETEKQVSAFAKTGSARLRKLVPYASVAAVALIAVMALKFYSETPALDDNQGKAVAVNQDRLNRSPREEVTTAELPIEELEEARSSDIIAGQPLGFDNSIAIEEEVIATEENIEDVSNALVQEGDANPQSSSPAVVEPSQVVPIDPAALAGGPDDEMFKISEIDIVVVLGSFGNVANASKMTEDVAQAGLIPYVDKSGSLTRVGATFSVSSEAELEEVKAQMRKQFNPNAWVLD